MVEKFCGWMSYLSSSPSSSNELKDSLSLSKSVKIYEWSTTHIIWAAI